MIWLIVILCPALLMRFSPRLCFYAGDFCVFLEVKNFSSSPEVLGKTDSTELVLCIHNYSQYWSWYSSHSWSASRSGPQPAPAQCGPPASWPSSACSCRSLTPHTSHHYCGTRSQLWSLKLKNIINSSSITIWYPSWYIISFIEGTVFSQRFKYNVTHLVF